MTNINLQEKVNIWREIQKGSHCMDKKEGPKSDTLGGVSRNTNHKHGRKTAVLKECRGWRD